MFFGWIGGIYLTCYCGPHPNFEDDTFTYPVTLTALNNDEFPSRTKENFGSVGMCAVETTPTR